jgi:hypothetical protein
VEKRVTAKTGTIAQKHTDQVDKSTDGSRQIWVFDRVDRDGDFRFDPHRDDMACKDVLDKIIHEFCPRKR